MTKYQRNSTDMLCCADNRQQQQQQQQQQPQPPDRRQQQPPDRSQGGSAATSSRQNQQQSQKHKLLPHRQHGPPRIHLEVSAASPISSIVSYRARIRQTSDLRQPVSVHQAEACQKAYCCSILRAEIKSAFCPHLLRSVSTTTMTL